MYGHVAVSIACSQEQTLGVVRQTLPDSAGQSAPLLSARVSHTRTRAPAVKGVEQLCKFKSCSPHLCCKTTITRQHNRNGPVSSVMLELVPSSTRRLCGGHNEWCGVAGILVARATPRPSMSLGPPSQGVLRGDPLVYEDHASPQGGCDLTSSSLTLQVNSQGDEKVHGAVSADLQEVNYVRRGETLKLFPAFDSKIASVSMRILVHQREIKKIVRPRLDTNACKCEA